MMQICDCALLIPFKFASVQQPVTYVMHSRELQTDQRIQGMCYGQFGIILYFY